MIEDETWTGLDADGGGGRGTTGGIGVVRGWGWNGIGVPGSQSCVRRSEGIAVLDQRY